MNKGYIKSTQSSFPVCKPKGTNIYRPFSYFVDGGLDLEKTNTDMTASVNYDSDEELGYGQTAVGCDPRVGFYEIAEQFGTNQAQEAAEVAPSAPMPTVNDEPQNIAE